MFDNYELIGLICSAKFPYYDLNSQSVKFKFRPVLVLEVENQYGLSDVTVLPVSKVSDKSRVIEEYDVRVVKSTYLKLNLTSIISYIRTSKINTVSTKDLKKAPIANLKSCYPELYQAILGKVKKYVNKFE